MSSNNNQPGLWDEPDPREPERSTSRSRRRPMAPPAVPPQGPPATHPETDRLWTVDDVSMFLGVPKKTIYAWRTAGKGPQGFLRVGKHLRWHPATVLAWSLRLEEEQ